MWRSADTILWLDYPPQLVMRRLLWRSAVRTATRAELFGGNRETVREWLRPQHPVWSAAATFTERREYLFDRTSKSAHCRTVRFTSPREFERWCQQLCSTVKSQSSRTHAWLRAARPAASHSGRAGASRDQTFTVPVADADEYHVSPEKVTVKVVLVFMV
jgi:hypothetical protein